MLERLKERAAAKGVPFRKLLNETLRIGLVAASPKKSQKAFSIPTHRAGLKPGLSYDKVESLLEFAEGPLHR